MVNHPLQRLEPRCEVTQQLRGIGELVTFYFIRSRFDGGKTVCHIVEMALGVGSARDGETQ